MKKMKKGFTIVELVIVIGVIAILSAILVPTFVNLSAKAKDAAKKQEVSDAFTQYVLAKSDAGAEAKSIEKVIIKRAVDTETDYYKYVNGEWTTEGASTAFGNLPAAEQSDGIDQVGDFTYQYLVVYEAA